MPSRMRPFDLVISAPNGLQEGQIYLLRLTVTSGDGKSSFGEVIVKTNTAPMEGEFDVSFVFTVRVSNIFK